MKQLTFDFTVPSLSEEATNVLSLATLDPDSIDRTRRAARMNAVLNCFPPLQPNLTPAQYMAHPRWFLRYLISTEAYFYARHLYWLEALAAGRVPQAPIPQISFQAPLPVYSRGVWSASLKPYPALKMLVETMNFPHSSGLDLRDKAIRFVDWLLGAAGSPRSEGLVKIDSEEAEWYYRTFKLHLLYEYPADYMACFSVALAGGRGNRLGHFPTPGCIANFMAQMLFADTQDAKTASVLDPAAGTGILLLYASNFSLNLHAVDISATMCKLLEFNALAYLPSMIFPAEFHPDGTLTPK